MKKKRKYIYLEKCLIIRILQIYIFSFYDFLFFISLSYTEFALVYAVFSIIFSINILFLHVLFLLSVVYK